jgi:hypothetical protein
MGAGELAESWGDPAAIPVFRVEPIVAGDARENLATAWVSEWSERLIGPIGLEKPHVGR